ncbi:hypothetical protein [Deferrisoma camini]|uniref:hypothetical protein n=1 Tax=Deferrisoma camini TaxID=1035120 RepID=UPI00046D602C|nr:hypothetical protein [Deferrisoma camini]NOY45769.1 hypothetical protein [Deltaproteobacteria bacterium]
MLFERYRRMNHRDRALLDGRLITYHFYVGGVTLLALGWIGIAQHGRYAWVAVVFGLASLAMGAGLHWFHRRMIRSPHRDAYLVTITAALGRHRFPLLPSLLGILIVFSVAVTLLYLLSG